MSERLTNDCSKAYERYKKEWQKSENEAPDRLVWNDAWKAACHREIDTNGVTKKIVDYAFQCLWDRWYGDYDGKMPVDKMAELIAETKCQILNLI